MLQRITRLNKLSRKVLSFVLPAVFAWLFTIIAIFYFADYGIALFIGIPFFLGMTSTILYGYGANRTVKESITVTTYSLLTYCVGLLLFALEGAICIIMAAPLGLVIAMVDSLFGEAVLKYRDRSPLPVVVGLGLMIPLMMSFEDLQGGKPEIFSVTSSVEIDATQEKVWEKVITFSRIDEPKELLFRAGVAYPTHAEIKGAGTGAIRYCVFSTGRFVEPITTWNEPALLEFSVQETPEPLKEISPYDIKPTHLHGYFVSVKGQFKLTKTKDNKTMLEGTTWYYHKIAPAFYWRIWSNYIIHNIHNRVLQHIKKEAE